ncbi:ATP-binding protein [Candidatus Peregrinibacteria bacterium]|nr:ATP-binding protein [Candidatus Peregrinibacteria bacterium]
MEEILYRYNPWWEKKYELKELYPRASILTLMKNNLTNKQVVFLTGLRRVGKTSLMRLLIKNLIDEEKIIPKNIFYVSMDDYVLGKKTIIELLEEYRKIHEIRFQEKIFVFLDEITYQDNFELQLKNIVDGQNVKIYASSSSASILKNKKVHLTGRNIIIEVLPLDFEEYLQFKKIILEKSNQHLVSKYFENFMQNGGLPEYVMHNDIEYLKELVDDIIYKDIAAIHNLKNQQNLKDFFLLLMERAGKLVSINKVANILNISADSAKRYLRLFEDTYLIHTVQRMGKINERIISPKKIYAADLGIRALFTGLRDKGSFFENYVYLKIKKQKPRYLLEKGVEIDFFTEKKVLIEVKYNSDLTEKQKKLCDKTKANKKITVKSVNDIKLLRNL